MEFGCTKDGDQSHKESTFTAVSVVEISRVFRIPRRLIWPSSTNYSLRCGDSLPFRQTFT